MRFRQLHIYTDHFEEQVGFYHEVLEIDLLELKGKQAKFKFGTSVLVIEERRDVPAYHFAVNIPYDCVETAHRWLKERLNILPFQGKDIVEFPAWNARAVYFYDFDKNIIEFIGRKDITVPPIEQYGPACLLGISEVGAPVKSMQKAMDQLQQLESPPPPYTQGDAHFQAVGDAEGLLILVDPDHKKWMPTDDPIAPAPFQIHLGDECVRYDDGQFDVVKYSGATGC